MAVRYKQKCGLCRKNFVLANYKTRFVKCYDCQKKEMSGTISDPEMEKMFDIPEKFYENNSFLRDIKVKYLTYGELTEKQLAAFKKTVEEMKNNS